MRIAARSGVSAYVLSITSVLVALLLVELVWPLHQRPHAIFLAAIVVSGWFGGLIPGLVAAGLSSLALVLIVLQPSLSRSEAMQLGTFVAIALLISALNEWRSRAEQAERRQREWLRVTLASIADAVVVVDARGMISFINGAAEALTKWDAAAAVGRSVAEVFRIVNENTRAAADPVARLLSGENLSGDETPALLIRADGTEVPIDHTAAPMLDTHERVSGVVVVFRDVSERRQNERVLQQSERVLTDFFDNASIGLHWVGADGRILRVNQAELDLFGYAREEYVGRPIADFHVDRAAIDDILRRLSAGGTIHDYEARMRCKDGSIRHVLISSNVYSEGGRFVHTRCFTRDITAQKQAEQQRQQLVELLENERGRLEAVLRRMPGGLIIVEVPSGRVLLQSQQAHLLPGPPTTDVNEYVERLSDHYEHYPVPDQWPLQQTLRTGEVVTGVELEFVAKDGRRTTLRANSAPIHDSQGRMVAVLCTFDDVSEAKRAEETLRFLAGASTALAASLDYQTTLTQVARLAVPQLADWCMLHILQEDGSAPLMTVAHVDPAKERLVEELYRRYPVALDAQHGYPKVVRTGETEFASYVAPSAFLATARDATHLEMLRGLTVQSMLCVPLKAAGRILGAMTLATGESGRRFEPADVRLVEHFARRAGTAIDNARLYGQMAEADRRKSEFLATMAHELRNPLAPVRNALEIMRLRSDERSTLDAMRQMIDRQVSHITHLIDDLLDLARVTRGKIRLRREIIDLAEVIQRAVESHRSLIDGKRQHLTYTPPDQVLLIDGDATRLEQILSNLLSNAVKYTDPEGNISLSVARDGDDALLRVRDTGRGIAAEVLPVIFDCFARGTGSDDINGGLGIGLTLVRSLVELHGGTVKAVSDGAGQGSEFVVRLPLSTAKPAPSAVDVAATRPTMRLRALVVDDNVNSADSLGMLLELWGHEVRVAYDGPSALERASDLRPQVVLLDLGLPGLDGYQVAHELRARADLGSILLVAITGHGQDDDRQRSHQAGFDHHLVKPLEPETLRRLVDEWSATLQERKGARAAPSRRGYRKTR